MRARTAAGAGAAGDVAARALVAQEPLGLPLRPALLGRGAAPDRHPRPPARRCCARGAGERVLEIGPGTGYYTLDMAEWVGPEGTVEIFDIQQEMLDHTMRRAAERGLDERRPDPGRRDRAALRGRARWTRSSSPPCSARSPSRRRPARDPRVLRPDGRLVVGELFGDPHFTTQAALRRQGAEAGLCLRRALRQLVRLRGAADAGLQALAPDRLAGDVLEPGFVALGEVAGLPLRLGHQVDQFAALLLGQVRRRRRSRPFFTSQTETAQTIVQGTRFQAALALRSAIR